MVNKYVPHVFVLPEDDANSELANGFLLHEELDQRAIQILNCVGGWAHVREKFEEDHINAMRRFPLRHMILLVDFDDRANRFQAMIENVPDDLRHRVFVVGVSSEPEDLPRANLGTNETVGYQLAQECFEESRTTWKHELLKHNVPELDRMAQSLRPFLFPNV